MAYRKDATKVDVNQSFLQAIGPPLLPNSYVIPGSGWKDVEIDRKGANALIIGATGSEKSAKLMGIGEALARQWHEYGINVIGTSRSGNLHQDHFPYKMAETKFEITDKESLAKLVAEVSAEFDGRLDLLWLGPVANMTGTLAAFTADELASVFDNNVISWFRVIQTFVPMMSNVDNSLIGVVSSVASLIPPPGGGPYGMTKATIVPMVTQWNSGKSLFGVLNSADKIHKTKMFTILPSYVATNHMSHLHVPERFPSGVDKNDQLQVNLKRQWVNTMQAGDPASVLAEEVSWIISRKQPEWVYIAFNKTLKDPCDLNLRSLIGLALNVPHRIVIDNFLENSNVPTVVKYPDKYYQQGCAPDEMVENPPFPIGKIGLCAACGLVDSEMPVCGKCHAVAYCSLKCQKKDRIHHKTKCLL